MKPRCLLRLAPLLLSSVVATTAHASTTLSVSQPPPPVARSMWKPTWPTFSKLEGAATVAAGAGTAALFVLKPPSDPRWEGPVLFDDGVRNAFRLDDATARKRARSWGDLPYYAAPMLPLIIDPIFVAWLARDDAKAAANMAAVGLEAFSYAGLLSFVSTRLSVRERPDARECRLHPVADRECEPDTEAFYSGHTTIAAASAGIVCANHRSMPLWGNPVADASACVLATTGAMATGVSRLAADRHYATDVIAGFGMGFGIGYAVPTLLHYARKDGDGDVALSIAPGGPCTGACLKLAGSF